MRFAMVFLLAALASAACAGQPPPTRSSAPAISLPGDPDLGVRPKVFEAPSSYAAGRCVEVVKRRIKRAIGVACAFDDPIVLADLGVEQRSEASGGDTRYVVVTGTSEYAMRPFRSSTSSYAASVDCDAGSSEPAYRPTGTCYVAILRRAAGSLVYVNLLLRDERKLTAYVSFDGAERAVAGLNVASAPSAVSASTTYALSLTGCPLSLRSIAGGFVALQSTDPKAGYFARPGFAPGFDLALDLRCVDRSAAEVCPGKVLARGDLDAQTWRRMKVTHYPRISGRYEGSADASTFTAVRPPRQRVLDFCMGDGKRTLIGRAGVGNERREVTAQVLTIVGSIRFTE